MVDNCIAQYQFIFSKALRNFASRGIPGVVVQNCAYSWKFLSEVGSVIEEPSKSRDIGFNPAFHKLLLDTLLLCLTFSFQIGREKFDLLLCAGLHDDGFLESGSSTTAQPWICSEQSNRALKHSS